MHQESRKLGFSVSKAYCASKSTDFQSSRNAEELIVRRKILTNGTFIVASDDV